MELLISFYCETRDKRLPAPKAAPSLDPTGPSSQASFLKELPTLPLFHNSLSLHVVIWLLPSLSVKTAVPKSQTCSCQWTFLSLYFTLPPGEKFDHPLFLYKHIFSFGVHTANSPASLAVSSWSPLCCLSLKYWCHSGLSPRLHFPPHSWHPTDHLLH